MSRGLEIRQLLERAAFDICGLDLSVKDPGERLEALGIDSLDLLEVAMYFEEITSLAVDPMDLDEVVTYGDLIEALQSLADVA